MTHSDSMSLGECVSAITQIVAQQMDLGTIQESLRLSRLQLGEAIERLENTQQKSEVFGHVRGHAESVAIEVAALLKAIQTVGTE